MRHSILTLLIATIGALGLYAQESEGSKILVFRNTGEINIFNSDSISKIELSVYDTDSIQHDDFVTQVFHHKNSSFMSIPLEEIDSVAFGYRNIIEPKKGVRRLTDEEAQAIISFDGENILYDSRLSMNEGEFVYYDLMTETLPFALCVKINHVAIESGYHRADVTMLDPSDVFNRYLITGNEEEIIGNRIKKADDYTSSPFELDLPRINENGTRIEGKAVVNLDSNLSEIVINPLKGYYHAKLALHLIPNIDFKFYAPRKYERYDGQDYDQRWKVCIPLHPSILKTTLAFDLFVDLIAEIGVEYEYSTDYIMNVEWTHKNGENIFSNCTINNEDSDVESHQKIEAHIDGEVFGGIRADACIHIPWRALGAGAEFKYGLKLEGELSAGLLADMTKEFSPETYAKGEIHLDHGFKLETYLCNFNLRNFDFKDLKNLFQVDKTKLPFEWEKFWNIRTIKLFPEFNSKAVMAKETAPIVQTGDEADAVTISTFVEEEVAYPLDISFEIANKDTDEILAETEVIDTIEMETKDTQTLYTEIVIPDELNKIEKESIIARPIIHYKGYKVKAQPANIAGDMILTPNICSMTGGSSYFVSGMTPISQHTDGETTYIEGNLVGYGVKSDPRYKKRKFKMYEFIDLSDPESCNSMHGEPVSLYGVWTGKIADEDVSFTFTDNENGLYNGTPFTYTFNSPQRGGIAIQLSTGGSISFHIVDISDDSMTIIMKGSEKEVILDRNN